MKTPTKQKQQVIWYLYVWKSFSLKDVINDSMFHKFQTRLGEIETDYGLITKKTSKKFINRFGNSSDYLIYEAIDKNKLLELFDKV